MSDELQSMTKEQKDELSKQKLEEMRKKNEAIQKRREEVLADQRSAEQCGSSMTNAFASEAKPVDRIKKRQEVNEDDWRAERKQIDEQRVARNSGKSREWDKVKLEEGFEMEDDDQNVQYNGNRRQGNFSSRGGRRFGSEWWQFDRRRENIADFDRGFQNYENVKTEIKDPDFADQNDYKTKETAGTFGEGDRSSRNYGNPVQNSRTHDKDFYNHKNYEAERSYGNTRKFPENTDYRGRKYPNSYRNNQPRPYQEEKSRNYSSSWENRRETGNRNMVNDSRRTNFGNRVVSERRQVSRTWSHDESPASKREQHRQLSTSTPSAKICSGTWSDQDDEKPRSQSKECVQPPQTEKKQTSGTWSDDEVSVPKESSNLTHDTTTAVKASSGGTWSDQDDKKAIPENKKYMQPRERATQRRQTSGTWSDDEVPIPKELSNVTYDSPVKASSGGTWSDQDDEKAIPENKKCMQPPEKAAQTQRKKTSGTWSDDEVPIPKEFSNLTYDTLVNASSGGTWSGQDDKKVIPESKKYIESSLRAAQTQRKETSGTWSDDEVSKELSNLTYDTSVKVSSGGTWSDKNDNRAMLENKKCMLPPAKTAQAERKNTSGTWTDDDEKTVAKELNSNPLGITISVKVTSGTLSDDDNQTVTRNVKFTEPPQQSNMNVLSDFTKVVETPNTGSNDFTTTENKQNPIIKPPVHPLKTPYDHSDDEFEELSFWNTQTDRHC